MFVLCQDRLGKMKLRVEIFTGPAMSGRTNWEM
jgi:hypothetical protein